MANRSMSAKLRRARAQVREAAAIEFSKPWYLTRPSKDELRAMVCRPDGVVVQRCPGAAIKRRVRSYGHPTRRGSILTPDVYVIETRLIRRGVEWEECQL
jgi:hypothetical protein